MQLTHGSTPPPAGRVVSLQCWLRLPGIGQHSMLSVFVVVVVVVCFFSVPLEMWILVPEHFYASLKNVEADLLVVSQQMTCLSVLLFTAAALVLPLGSRSWILRTQNCWEALYWTQTHWFGISREWKSWSAGLLPSAQQEEHPWGLNKGGCYFTITGGNWIGPLPVTSQTIHMTVLKTTKKKKKLHPVTAGKHQQQANHMVNIREWSLFRSFRHKK